MAKWTTSDKIGCAALVVALIALPAAWLAVPWEKFKQPQQRPLESPPRPEPVTPKRLAPVMGTIFDEVNEAGQPFPVTQSFEKNNHYTQPPKQRGGDNNTPGHEIKIDYQAPGPIMTLDCGIRPGGGAAWTAQDICSFSGDSAHWEGWSNSGAPATIVFNIRYKRPRQGCIRNCG